MGISNQISTQQESPKGFMISKGEGWDLDIDQYKCNNGRILHNNL